MKTIRKEFYLKSEVVEALKEYSKKFNMSESDSLNDILLDYFLNFDLQEELKEVDYSDDDSNCLVF